MPAHAANSFAAHLGRVPSAPTDEAALVALLDAWRAAPYDELVPLIEHAGARAARPPVLAKTFDDQQDQWLQLAQGRAARDLPWLIANLFCARGEPTAERLSAIASWPADPRFASLLLAACGAKPLTSRQNRPIWTRTFALLRKRLEPRLLPQIDQLSPQYAVTEFDDYFRYKLRWLRERLQLVRPKQLPPLSPLATGLLQAAASKLEITRTQHAAKTAEDFLAEIYRTPADDGPREVFADWLIERGDPRGELITLQLTRKRDPRAGSERRERELLKQHAREWMGPLEPVIAPNGFVFERGFLAACQVRWRKLGAQRDLMTHPAWSTVRRYAIDPEGERLCDRWIDHMIALGAKRA